MCSALSQQGMAVDIQCVKNEKEDLVVRAYIASDRLIPLAIKPDYM